VSDRSRRRGSRLAPRAARGEERRSRASRLAPVGL
jgi:hypothetical protein